MREEYEILKYVKWSIGNQNVLAMSILESYCHFNEE
jgi:hypothetical protein